MNEERTLPEFSNQLLKILFGKTVEAFGKQDAAAAHLGMSRQYISAMANTDNEEHANTLPRWEHVFALEAKMGRSVVFRTLADMAEPARTKQGANAAVEVNDVVMAAAKAVAQVISHQNGSATPEDMHTALDVVQQELAEARAALPSRTAKVVQFRGEVK